MVVMVFFSTSRVFLLFLRLRTRRGCFSFVARPRPLSLPLATLLLSVSSLLPRARPPSSFLLLTHKQLKKNRNKQFVGLAAEVGFSSVVDALPATIDRFSPLFAGDHAVAM